MSESYKLYHSWEHNTFILERETISFDQIHNKHFLERNDCYCYKKILDGDEIKIEAGYYIGVDWLINSKAAIIVAPKINTRPPNLKQLISNGDVELDEGMQEQQIKEKQISIDYLAMLQLCLSDTHIYQQIDNLVHIDWKAKEIHISQSQDWLSPLIIVKFLNTLKQIVRKGLKKSYYSKTTNLQSRIKGKILISQNIKQNILKNRQTKTICRFDEFGIDNIENRLLKKAFRFACSYLYNHKKLFGVKSIEYFNELMNYCQAPFDLVGDEVVTEELKSHKPNPFFKEYTEGVHLATLLLKRYAYTISNTTKEILSTPPYWIDMPKLFELYAYNFLRGRFLPNEVKYHLKTYGNELDFLIKSADGKTGFDLVVDAKYKPAYAYSKNHQDIRQVSGYARLEKVYKELGFPDDNLRLIDCLIIYPDLEMGHDLKGFRTVGLKSNPISGYRNIYKIGIMLPSLY